MSDEFKEGKWIRGNLKLSQMPIIIVQSKLSHKIQGSLRIKWPRETS